mgnify:CR=1 FL=1
MTHAADPSLVCDASVQADLVSMNPYLYLGDSGSGSTTVNEGNYSVQADWTVDLTGSTRTVDVTLSLTGDGYYLQHTLLWYLVPSSEITEPPSYGGVVAWSNAYGPVTTNTTHYDFTSNANFQGVYGISAKVSQCTPAAESSPTSSTEATPSSSPTESTEPVTATGTEASFPQTGGTDGTLAILAFIVVVAGSTAVVLSRRQVSS